MKRLNLGPAGVLGLGITSRQPPEPVQIEITNVVFALPPQVQPDRPAGAGLMNAYDERCVRTGFHGGSLILTSSLYTVEHSGQHSHPTQIRAPAKTNATGRT